MYICIYIYTHIIHIHLYIYILLHYTKMICNSLILEHLYMSTLAGCVPSALGATAGSVEGREVGSDAKQSWGELPWFMVYISLYMCIYI